MNSVRFIIQKFSKYFSCNLGIYFSRSPVFDHIFLFSLKINEFE